MKRVSNRHTTGLHPGVYRAVVGLTALYVLAVWYGFSGREYTDYLLFVVTAFLAFCVGLASTAGRLQRQHPSARPASRDSFERWAKTYVDVADKPVKGYIATVEILLPLAAVAFGMLAFAVLAHIVG
ncbi:hypothetical protein [Chelativorans xinjiangense]|uniref:hypothetical protein n=1 Tax=Chelativorans xinjiangense TaxID=2681485 RepID=UPI001357429F|nr:hypothetical protein [Chelativorans xinjiangense]